MYTCSWFYSLLAVYNDSSGGWFLTGLQANERLSGQRLLIAPLHSTTTVSTLFPVPVTNVLVPRFHATILSVYS